MREYVWGQGMGGGIGGLLSMRQSGQDYFYLYDGKGNVTAVVDSSQQVVATYQYNAFGRLMQESGTLEQPFRFSTKRYDAGTGLNYYGYRFYAPAIERWLNRDPLGEAGGINLYGFVSNDPVNFVDPDGLARKGNKGDGSATGKNTSNPYKHCKQHPKKPNMLQCKDKRTGKKKDVPKPPDWDNNNQQSEMCDDECRKVAQTAALLGGGYAVYKIGKICILTFVGGPVGFGIGVATP